MFQKCISSDAAADFAALEAFLVLLEDATKITHEQNKVMNTSKPEGAKRRHDVFLINFPLLTYKTTSEILQMSFRGVCNV